MTTSSHISMLVNWAAEHGARLHPSVEVYQDSHTGLSFRVKPDAAALTPYEPIVSIPTVLTLSYLDARAEQGPKALPKRFIDEAPPHVVGRFFLVKEYLRGRESFWWPYIQALPQPDDRLKWALPPFWPSHEAELLDGTNVEVGLDKIKRDTRREYKEARQLLTESCCSSQGDSPDIDIEAYSTNLYRWAYCVFSSRSFRPSLVLSPEQQRQGPRALPDGVTLDDFSVLLPLFDVGNHDMTADIRWELGSDDGSCALRVGKAHGPGDQVFNNYSMKTNAELLLGYNFILPATDALHNDYTHVRKRTDTPAASEEYLISLRPLRHPSSVLARYKQSLRLPDAVPVIAAFQHVQPEMAWDIFCTMTQPAQREVFVERQPGEGSDAAEKRLQAAFFAGRLEGEGQAFLEQTAAVIQHKLLQELERLNETDVEPVGADDAHMLTRNQQLALDYRERCRQVLEGALEAMNDDETLGAQDGEAIEP